jgi:hypothetical protein
VKVQGLRCEYRTDPFEIDTPELQLSWTIESPRHGQRQTADQHVPAALNWTGNRELADRLLTNTSYPSWGCSIHNGATTVWERLDRWTEEHGFKNSRMNSFCHYPPGSVCK